MAKRRILIGRFGPSARQITDAAKALMEGPECEVVVDNAPLEGTKVLGGVPFVGRRFEDYDRGLAYLHDLTARNKLVNQVFLGGSCNPTTWRKDTAIPMLEEEGCAFYNPQVDDWSPELMDIEAEAKTSSYVVLFVLDDQTRGIATLNEIVEFIAGGRQKVVLVNGYINAGLDIAGQTISAEEAMDINIARAEVMGYAKAKGVRIFNSVEIAMNEIIGIMQDAEYDHQVDDVAGQVG